MGHVGAERWFHTLVVMGASLAGCGGTIATEPSPAMGGSGGSTGESAGRAGLGSGGGRPSSNDCAFAAQFVCQDYRSLTGCHCDPSAPLDKSACASPFDFVCDDGPCEPSPNDSGPTICLGPTAIGCRCDPKAPRPEDCGTPEQFFCASIERRYLGCTCYPGPAPSPDSCVDEYCCQSYDPRFGCSCTCAAIR